MALRPTDASQIVASKLCRASSRYDEKTAPSRAVSLATLRQRNSLLEELQRHLRSLIGLSQDRHCRLLQDLVLHHF
jgi:hypothetical protein